MRVALDQLDFIHPMVKELARAVETFTGEEETITSIYRLGDSGVHGTIPVRGLDLRCRDAAKGRKIANYINSRYIYDPDRPKLKCCIFHDVGQGKHLHLQCHPRTRRKG